MQVEQGGGVDPRQLSGAQEAVMDDALHSMAQHGTAWQAQHAAQRSTGDEAGAFQGAAHVAAAVQ